MTIADDGWKPMGDNLYNMVASSDETRALPEHEWPEFCRNRIPGVVDVLAFRGDDYSSSHVPASSGAVAVTRVDQAGERHYRYCLFKDVSGNCYIQGQL